MIGLVRAFYWQHHRSWGRWKEVVLYICALTNKNWFSIRRKLIQVAQRAGIILILVKK